VADSFDLSGVTAGLASTIFANKLHHLPSVGSTNQVAIEAALSGAPHGSAWIADEQTAGRGRSNHTWHSTTGDGLYVSALLRPNLPLSEASWISLATGLAVQSAIAHITGLSPDIRWPNDLLIQQKKCGGILVETAAIASPSDAPSTLRYAVIGVGININHQIFPAGLENIATSLRRESGKSWPREQLLVELLLALQHQIALLESELQGALDTPGILKRFAAASTWVQGKRVRVDEAGGYTGVTDGLDHRGFLRVAADDGTVRTVLSGGVRAQ
jgi:BirA family biotin operon repressor/biotin-[acetyl-CoA-carboxylase] ligase